MAKVKVVIGYKEYVIDADAGLKLLEILGDAEIFESKYHSGADNTYHIYAQPENPATLQLIPKSLYTLWKLAGKPES
jgi:hypothetical protein